MQNGKYIPPQLRGASGGPPTGAAAAAPPGGGGGGGGDPSLPPPPANYGPGAGRREPNYDSYAAPTNSRWSDFNTGGGYRGGDRGGGYDGYSRDRGGGGGARGRGGGGGYRGSYARKNEFGFHGDLTPNPRLEEKLFSRKDVQSAGINFEKYDDIPVETSEGCPAPIDVFTPETVGEQLMRNLTLCQFAKPTPVQKYSIPIGIAGRDMMACAQTGSGKTAGFLFPVISLLLKRGAPPTPEAGPESALPVALILAPTRELAMQIFDEAQKFCYCTGLRPVVVYGGAEMRNQKRELDRGCDIIVATPGRLVDIIERGYIRLSNIRFLILDEADRMLDMGFEPQIRRIVEEEGMPIERQTFMFSATFPRDIQRLAGDFMHDYIFLAVGRVGAASKDVIQTVEWVEQDEKVDYLVDFLSRAPEGGLILVFCETKRGADYLENILYRNQFPACSIHGDKTQREREDALRQFKSGRCPILVATDVAARGLDISNVTQVINFDLPSNVDDYVHRIGRTGRVGNVGHALSLMNDKNRNIARELADLLIENDQECPPWLQHMSQRGGSGRSSGGSRGRGSKFGARDFRKDRDFGGGGGQRGGGYGGGSGYGGGPPSYRSGPPGGGGYYSGPPQPMYNQPVYPQASPQAYGGYPPLGSVAPAPYAPADFNAPRGGYPPQDNGGAW